MKFSRIILIFRQIGSKWKINLHKNQNGLKPGLSLSRDVIFPIRYDPEDLKFISHQRFDHPIIQHSIVHQRR